MQTKPRLLVNLLAKLTRIEPLMGAMGPWGAPLCQFQGQGPGNTLGRGSYGEHSITDTPALLATG